MPEVDQQPHGKPALVVVGELNADLIFHQVQALPQLGTERLASGMALTLGSSSAILAANAAALGTRVEFVGRVGMDIFGPFVLDALRRREVDVSQVLETPDLPTGLTAIYTHGSERGMLTYTGAMSALTIEDIPWANLERAQHLHVSSYYLQSGLRPDCATLFERAKTLGLSTSFDTNWDPAEQWSPEIYDVLEHVDVFLPNDDEARLISGETDLSRAMEKLASYAQAVVVTCGADGVRARTMDRELTYPSVPVEPIDAVGAGDSFNAGFLHRYLQGDSIESCLRFGLLTGAYSTLAAGGTGAFDDMDAFDQFARRAAETHPLQDAT